MEIKKDIADKNLFIISKFAKLTNMSTVALRHYHQLNILMPYYIDPNTNYRYYSLLQVEDVRLIKALQYMGFSLKKIKEFIDNRSVEISLGFLKSQRDNIENEILELSDIRTNIMGMIERINGNFISILKDKIQIKTFPKRVSYGNMVNCKTDIDIIYNAYTIFKTFSIKSTFSDSFALMIPKEDLLTRSYHEHYYVTIFNHNISDFKKGVYEIIIEAGEFASLRYNGGIWKREETLKNLMAYIENNNYTIVGDAIQINTIDEDVTRNEDEFIFEIQIPIQRPSI